MFYSYYWLYVEINLCLNVYMYVANRISITKISDRYYRGGALGRNKYPPWRI